MADKTGIEWTDVTWNPVRGCSRVSEGCRHCYAERVAARFSGPGQPYEGLVKTVREKKGLMVYKQPYRTETRWNGTVRLVPEHLADPLRWRKPRRVFVNSMSDLFHEALSNEDIAAVFGVMAAAPRHTFQVLTKRAKRMREWFAWVAGAAAGANVTGVPPSAVCLHHAQGEAHATAGRPYLADGDNVTAALRARWPLPNVWLGVSVENQAAADERIPDLLATPAALRFLSCEPLLGPVRIADGDYGWLTCDGTPVGDNTCCESHAVHGEHFRGVDWVIAGCESGPGARPAEVDWYRSLRDQCAAAGAPFFLKQAKRSIGGVGIDGAGRFDKPGDLISLPYLDDAQHAAFPEPR